MGHEERVRELYDGCYRRLVGQLFAFCGDVSEAEDAVQPGRGTDVDGPGCVLDHRGTALTNGPETGTGRPHLTTAAPVLRGRRTPRHRRSPFW